MTTWARMGWRSCSCREMSRLEKYRKVVQGDRFLQLKQVRVHVHSVGGAAEGCAREQVLEHVPRCAVGTGHVHVALPRQVVQHDVVEPDGAGCDPELLRETALEPDRHVAAPDCAVAGLEQRVGE